MEHTHWLPLNTGNEMRGTCADNTIVGLRVMVAFLHPVVGCNWCLVDEVGVSLTVEHFGEGSMTTQRVVVRHS